MRGVYLRKVRTRIPNHSFTYLNLGASFHPNIVSKAGFEPTHLSILDS